MFFVSVGNVFASENMSADSSTDILSDADNVFLQNNSQHEMEVLQNVEQEVVSGENEDIEFTSDVVSGVDEITVQFKGTSNKDVSNWIWDFGDGQSDEGQNISHKYSKFGSYNVSLTTLFKDNTNSSLIKNNYINVYYNNGTPIKNPDFEEGDVGLVGNVHGWEIINGSLFKISKKNNLMKYIVNTGDRSLTLPATYWENIGNTGQKRPTGIPSIGQFINFDCIDNISFYALLYNTGNPQPQLNFNVSIGELFIENYNFNVSRIWNLITIDTSNINGTHFFNIYRTSDDRDAPTGYLDTFTVSYNDKTHAEFNYAVENIVDNKINIQFDNLAYGSITDFLWQFDDGTVSNEVNPSHNFTSGSHTVKLTASNINHTDTYSYDFVLEFPSVNGQIYETIQDAIDNATDGDVIDIPADLSENININKNLTLNFNGNKLISSGSSPVIQVTGGAQATIKNITLENSNVLSTDDESSLTIAESNIADTNITLTTGNIALDGNDFTGSFITVTNANAVIANNNIANGGIKVTGGKSKINNNVLSGNDVAITQTEGETNITSNVITDNNIGVNITNGTSNINFNVLYNNNEVSLAYVGTVDATNNWFGVTFPSFNTISDKDVDIYAPEAESQPTWLILTLNTNETTLYSAQNYTIDVNLTLNSNGNDTSSLGVLPKFSLPVSTKMGETSAVNVENGVGEFELITGTLTSDDVIFSINGEDYTLDVTVFKIEDRVKELETQLAEAQANATKLAEDLDNANQKVSNLTTQLNETQANATKLAEDLADANQKAENLTTQLGDAQKQIQTLSADLISTAVAANNLSIKALTSGNIQVTLKANGTALANKTVNVIINGVTYNGTTGEDGVSKIAVKFASAGTYYATVTFAGDDTYKSSIGTSKVVVSKKATKITAPKKSFKAKVKTKKVKITLKSDSTVLKSKKITLKVNGKTYTAKTNSKGVATIKVTKLTKKGTFTYTVKFAGDKAYKAITKKGKMTIK